MKPCHVALSHGGDTVTDIYIDLDVRKIDEANWRVLDWVLYGKSDGSTCGCLHIYRSSSSPSA